LSKFPATRNGGILRERTKKLRMATGSVEMEAWIDTRINGDTGERRHRRMKNWRKRA
jgi:hypothetical protein